jgi:Protein  of unknown function (DUF3018)
LAWVARYPQRMNAESPRDQDKFRRYRAAKKAAGLKEYRLWAPDWSSAEFQAEMKRAEVYFSRLDERNWMSEFSDQCMADASAAIEAEEARKGI